MSEVPKSNVRIHSISHPKIAVAYSKTMPCCVQGWGQYALVIITPIADNNIVLDKVCQLALYIQGRNFSGLNLV